MLTAELTGGSPAPAAPAAAPAPSPAENVPQPVADNTPAAPEAAAVDTNAPAPEPTPAPSNEPMLYETPDGRKVDAATLQREWKENFLPDYTRKSQELARMKSFNNQAPQPPAPQDNKPANPWESPDWQPQSWGEVLQIAEQRALESLTSKQQEAAQAQAFVETYVQSQVDQIKAIDPKADIDSVFAHANKYGFQDLSLAHANMKEIQNVRMAAEQNALRNIQTRAAEPIAKANGTVVDDGSVDVGSGTRFGSALEALRSIRK